MVTTVGSSERFNLSWRGKEDSFVTKGPSLIIYFACNIVDWQLKADLYPQKVRNKGEVLVEGLHLEDGIELNLNNQDWAFTTTAAFWGKGGGGGSSHLTEAAQAQHWGVVSPDAVQVAS